MEKTGQRIAVVLLMAVLAFAGLAMAPMTGAVPDSTAYADITVGDSHLEGWQPNDMIQTDIQVNADTPNEAAASLETVVIRLVKLALPFLMIACVAILIWNAVGNLFRQPENRVRIGDLLKNMFINFFWILFAWIIVEAIVFVITNGETILFATLLS